MSLDPKANDQLLDLLRRLSDELSSTASLRNEYQDFGECFDLIGRIEAALAQPIAAPATPSEGVVVPQSMLRLWHTVMLQSEGEYVRDCCDEMAALLSAAPSQDARETVDAGRWIPVSERLPVPHRRVLVKGGGNTFVAGWERENDNKWTIVNDAFLRFDEVTHWMPLPEPPK